MRLTAGQSLRRMTACASHTLGSAVRLLMSDEGEYPNEL